MGFFKNPMLPAQLYMIGTIIRLCETGKRTIVPRLFHLHIVASMHLLQDCRKRCVCTCRLKKGETIVNIRRANDFTTVRNAGIIPAWKPSMHSHHLWSLLSKCFANNKEFSQNPLNFHVRPPNVQGLSYYSPFWTNRTFLNPECIYFMNRVHFQLSR